MATLKPQDLLVVLKVAGESPGAPRPFAVIAKELGMSASEVHAGFKRASRAGLVDPETRRPRARNLLEFLEHGVRYAFMGERGPVTRGMPTAYSAPPLAGLLVASAIDGSALPIVWPDPKGSTRGESLEPLYPSAVTAARQDARLYEALALVDALRVGGSRERNLAAKLLAERLAA